MARVELEGNSFTVFGGAGFVGSHLVDHLLLHDPKDIRIVDNLTRGKRANLEQALADPRVSFIESSITDLAAVRKAVRGVDGVFHLAALWLDECLQHPRAAVDVNVGGTYNIIESCHAERVRRTVFSSSASVYGNALEIPMTEEHPFNNRTFYGATKIAGEQMFRAFNEAHQLDYVGLRYMNVYGPRMDDKGAYVSVIVKVLARLDEHLRPRIYGDGTQSYDFIHVSDVARANLLAMNNEASDEFFNIGAGVRTTVGELVAKILELTGSTLEPEYQAEGMTFVTHRIGSTERATRVLGFDAEISLEDGLRDVITWWRAAQKRAGLIAARDGD